MSADHSGADDPSFPSSLLPSQSVEHVLDRIERARAASPGGIVAFDADGTLWTGDAGIDSFEALLRESAVRPEAGRGLEDEARSAGVPLAADPVRQAALLYEAFGRGAYPEDRAYAMMAWSFAGFTPAEARAFARDALARAGLVRRGIDESRMLFDACRGRGLDVYVVSASPRAVIEAALELAGLEPAAIAAMTPVVRDERIAARVDPPWPYAEGKVAALRALAGERPLLAALGDSPFDTALLGHARVPVAVRPKPLLLARRTDVPGLVVLSRG